MLPKNKDKIRRILNVTKIQRIASSCIFFLTFIFFLIQWGITPLSSGTLVHAAHSAPVPVPKPIKMREWHYIVIHHSGAFSGNEATIEADHLRRGMENGMAYHFLIGNGSTGLGDGEVREGHRWKYQLPGGHCHQEFLNTYGIGICLVGNFNRKGPTPNQIKSLAALLFRLQAQFYISDENIHGHGQFYGEDSDCPGKLFPWANLWASLNKIYEFQLMSSRNEHLIQGK